VVIPAVEMASGAQAFDFHLGETAGPGAKVA
jgi:hypothetical protein